jgi:glycogen(starch) synthase
MKILLYTTFFLPEAGGVQAIALALAGRLNGRNLGDRNVEVTVATQQPADGFEDRALPFRILRRPSLLQLLGALRRADIVHLAGPSFLPLLLGLLLRKPVVIEHHGFHTICPNGQLFHEPTQTPCPGHFMAGRHRECLRCNAKAGRLASLKMWLLTFARRWLAHRVDVNITPTRGLETLLQLPRTTTILHGVSDHTGRLTIPSLKPPLTFAFVGRLVTTKGAHLLLEAAQRLKAEGLPFRLKIIGAGPERSRLERRAVVLQLNDSVIFYGYLPLEKVEQELADAAAIVVPSLAGEVFGLVVVENMLRGRLPIVSDIDAFSEVVGAVGLKFPPGDVEGLAACLRRVVLAPEQAGEMGRRARERGLQFFSESRMVADHLKVYCRLLGEPEPPC